LDRRKYCRQGPVKSADRLETPHPVSGIKIAKERASNTVVLLLLLKYEFS
jgi:hypothetical protein